MVYLECEYYILHAALASLQLLEGAEPEEVARLVELLDYLDREVICGTSFEFLQALLRATIFVHGEAIMQVRWCLATAAMTFWWQLPNQACRVVLMMNFRLENCTLKSHYILALLPFAW